MKKALSILLSLCIAASLGLTGCKTDDKKTSGDDAANLTDAGTYPVVKNKITLKVLSQQLTVISDIKTNEFTKWWEEKTNIHLDWQLVPQDAVKEKVNLTLASGDLPDIIFGCGLSSTQEAQFGVTEKLIIPLNELIDKEAPNFKKLMTQYPELKGQITNTDGKIYTLPSWNDCFHCSYQQKAWINKNWLDKLNLKMPSTVDDFYNVLKAFKNNDPNGNGKQDEVPVAGCIDGWQGDVTNFIMNAFQFDPGQYEATKRYVKDGKLDTSVNKDGYKEGLKFLNKLYKEGLLSKSSFTQKNDQIMQLVSNPEAPLLGITSNGASCTFVQMTNQDRYRQYVAMAPLKGPSGLQQTPHFKYSAAGNGQFAITKSCKYPEAAMRMADLVFTYEGAMRHSNGRPDKEWRAGKAGEVGINGKPAMWKFLIPYNNTDPQNESYLWLGLDMMTSDMRLGMEMDPKTDPFSPEGLEKMLYEETANKYKPYTSKEYEVCPPLQLLSEENQDLSTITVELEKFINESKIKFIVGEMDIDSNWDKYVKNLENIGLKKYLSIYQKAYDRQYKAK